MFIDVYIYIHIYDGCCVILQSRCDCRGDLVTQPELCCKTNGRLHELHATACRMLHSFVALQEACIPDE